MLNEDLEGRKGRLHGRSRRCILRWRSWRCWWEMLIWLRRFLITSNDCPGFVCQIRHHGGRDGEHDEVVQGGRVKRALRHCHDYDDEMMVSVDSIPIWRPIWLLYIDSTCTATFWKFPVWYDGSLEESQCRLGQDECRTDIKFRALVWGREMPAALLCRPSNREIQIVKKVVDRQTVLVWFLFS